MTELVQHPSGAFAYVPASTTFSNGLVVGPGYRLAEWEFDQPLPLRAAFDRVAQTLVQRDLTWEALAGVELRSPAPFSPQGFVDFNASYTALLTEYYPLPSGALAPYVRTNVAPVEVYLSEPSVRAVQIVEPHDGDGGDFVASGVAEVTNSATPADTIAYGDTSPEGMRTKVDYVVGALAQRVVDLGVPIERTRTIDVYTVHPLDWLEAVIAATFTSAARVGLHRWLASPPVAELEFEMGCKRVSARSTLSPRPR